VIAFLFTYKNSMKKFGLIGYPLGHSFSKKYFEEKFVLEKIIDNYFELFPLENIADFKPLLQAEPLLQGLAVTIPHKQTIMPFLDEISAAAMAIGAVNCIKITNGKTIGYNTDVVGFEKSLLPLLQIQHTQALVLGTGGASKAVQYVLQKINMPFTLVSRTANSKENIIGYEDITAEIINNNKLIINTTPLGMTPNEIGIPNLPYNKLTSQHLLYDLIYKPAQTKFLQEGEKQNCTTKNGFEMLIIQAEKNWEIWNSNI
jgi:shikimate dehydrogenase